MLKHKIPEITESYGLSALEVDRINRNTKPLDKEEREIHRRLMPKQKTKTIPITKSFSLTSFSGIIFVSIL